MKKSTSGKEVRFQKDQTTEDEQNDRTSNQAKGSDTLANDSRKPSSGAFPYRRVPAMKAVVEVPPLPARYMSEARKAPSYRHQTQVEENVDIKEVLTRLFGKEVTLTQQELLAMAPKLREMWKDVISKRRVPTSTNLFDEAEVEEDTLLDAETAELETWDVVDPMLLEAPKKV